MDDSDDLNESFHEDNTEDLDESFYEYDEENQEEEESPEECHTADQIKREMSDKILTLNVHETVTEKPPKMSLEAQKWYGYAPCDYHDKAQGRPLCCRPASDFGGKFDRANGYIFADDFTYQWVNFPCLEPYRVKMRKLIVNITDTAVLGSGDYWNPYFHTWVPEPLTPEYHNLIHEICRKHMEVAAA